MDLERDAEKAKNTIQGKIERGTERVKKALDKPENDLEHDVKIEGSKIKEDVRNNATDIRHGWDKDEDEE